MYAILRGLELKNADLDFYICTQQFSRECARKFRRAIVQFYCNAIAFFVRIIALEQLDFFSSIINEKSIWYPKTNFLTVDKINFPMSPLQI